MPAKLHAEAIIKVLVGIVMLFIIFTFIFLLLNLFKISGERESLNNVESLSIAINRLDVNSVKVYDAINNFPFFIHPNYIMVGFSKTDYQIEDVCQYEPVTKPKNKECTNSACLCLYQETVTDNDFDYDTAGGAKPTKCFKLDGVDWVFTKTYWDYETGDMNAETPKDNVYANILGGHFDIERDNFKNFYPDSVYSYLFIYGQCEDWWSDISLGTISLYIEKFSIPSSKNERVTTKEEIVAGTNMPDYETYLFISAKDSSTDDRFKFYTNKYSQYEGANIASSSSETKIETKPTS